jgi:UDP-glucose 4-epimerase
MKVVITGGSGFIGTNLMLYLAETEPDTEVVIFDIVPPQAPMHKNCRYMYGDIRSLASLLHAFEGADEVYNLAGILGTSELLDVPTLAAEVNIVGAANVMEAAGRCGAAVYNVAKPYFDGYSENAYTLTKHGGELYGLLYREKFGLPVATVRWLNAVGPYQHLYPVRKFLPMMVLFTMFGLDLEVYGDGTQTIDPIDTRDLSRFTVHAIRNLTNHDDVVDLGSGRAINCNDAAKTILEVTKREGFATSPSTIKNVPMRNGEKPGVNLVADMSYWDSVGLKTQYSFEESIIATVWYMKRLPEEHLANALKFYGVFK